MNKSNLALCLIFGIVCYTNAATNKATTTAFLKQLTAALNSTGAGTTNFPNSVAYVTNTTNQKVLLSGEQGCINFFYGLLAAFKTDLQNDKVKVEDARQQFNQFIQMKFPNLAPLLPK
ncbi:unnamed protein product [Adineta ricciae]|uniref:Uncharacterized protein n=1 Tax=Adineta ricciae TaxID=249248 RepID=A0A814ZIT5_ADIRI|nr:unnamed protein product [Adineta ricciae]CAF1450110.1 unnamed protein product [Adineta ricciae]